MTGLPLALRWIAIAIAIVAAVDPSVTVAGRVRPIVGLVAAPGSVADGLRRDLRAEVSIVDGADPAAVALVVVGDRYPPETISESARVATVTVPDERSVRIVSVSAPRDVPPGTTIHINADVIAVGLRDRTAILTAAIGGTELARATHEWQTDSHWRAALDVVPVGEPPFVVTLALAGSASRVDVSVDVSDRLPILVYDARPSWTTTFVRRALESDPRFLVDSVGLASRGVAIRTADAPQSLEAADLDRYRVVIAGGLDKLSASEATALSRFMIDHGGSVAVLPDARVDSDAARALVLVPVSPGHEVLLERPTALTADPPLPRIDASELLLWDVPQAAHVLARTADAAHRPIVWTLPRGEGRLLVSGAMDAWRFRSSTGVEFDRFWQSAIAGLALAVRPAVAVDVTPAAVSIGRSARVRVRVRGADMSQDVTVSAALSAGDVVRLWPDAEPGTFSGLVTPARVGVDRLDVTATIDGRLERASARFVAGAYAPADDDPTVPLAALSASHGGIDVGPDDLHALERWVRQTIAPQTKPMQRHPMRSAWWMVPFAGCLSIEWWVRRRRRLR